LGLIEQRINVFDRRHTTNRISSKGAALVRQIAGALGRPTERQRCRVARLLNKSEM
jgi:hypothetical protein